MLSGAMPNSSNSSIHNASPGYFNDGSRLLLQTSFHNHCLTSFLVKSGALSLNSIPSVRGRLNEVFHPSLLFAMHLLKSIVVINPFLVTQFSYSAGFGNRLVSHSKYDSHLLPPPALHLLSLMRWSIGSPASRC